jgi:[ribosomal protein S18]-alanine N-acetyltransferase
LKTETEKLNLTLKRMEEGDIPDVRALETICFNHTWPDESFRGELSNRKSVCYLVARDGDRLAGFIGAWLILDEVHITTIAVDPGFRGMRIGDMLVWALFDKAVAKGSRWATLEVNEKNSAACRLYESFEFKTIGRRTSYYGEGEDAVVMWRKDIQTEEFRKLLDEKRERWEEKICLSLE